MTVVELLSDFNSARLGTNPEREVSSICFDSRRLTAGCVFVAVRGASRDGHDFVDAAAAADAAIIVVEDASRVPTAFAGAVVVAPDSREALARLAARFVGDPSGGLYVVGVTGTNGKTTVTHMIEAILTEAALATGVIGTINHHLGARVWKTELTTPDPVEFQARLREFADGGAKAVALEASSHALDQRRVDAVDFDCAVFMNLTRDHLDYHAGMQSYFAAKARLFESLLAGSSKSKRFAVINVDDSYGARLHTELAKAPALGLRVWSFGSKADADFRASELLMSFEGTTFTIATPTGQAEVRLKMAGAHNVSNACAAIAASFGAGVPLETCVSALARLGGVSGRLERIENDKGVHVFVDFAHTDSALAGSLAFLGDLRDRRTQSDPRASRPRIFAVFGCGGDRDKGKRPMMMRAALAGADCTIVTSDNPRSEDPRAIIADSLAGLDGEAPGDIDELRRAIVGHGPGSGALAKAPSKARAYAEPDRRAAIELALRLAAPGDAVLIAGKGHEAYQQIGSEKRPFSDQNTAKEILS